MTMIDESVLMDHFSITTSADGQCLLISRHGDMVAMVSAMGSEPEFLCMDDGTQCAVEDVLARMGRSEQADIRGED